MDWNTLERVFEQIIFWGILYAWKIDLHELRCGLSAFCGQMGQYATFVHFCHSPDRESPEYFLTDHHNYLAAVHFARSWNERKWDL